jgi:hypothetical protein
MNKNIFRYLIVVLSAALLSYGGQQTDEYRAEGLVTGHYLNSELIGTIHFPTYGLQCAFPVGIDNTSLVFAAEYGTIPRTAKIIESPDVILSSIALRHTFFRLKELITLSASLSLNNCAMHLQPAGGMSNVVIIATWENEFGAGAGGDIGFQWKWFTVSVPLHVSVIFTGEPGYIYSCGVRIGLLFKKKRSLSK